MPQELSDGLCPYCGAELERGHVVGRGWLNWAKRPAPALIVNEALQERIASPGLLWQSAFAASRCAKCRVGFFRF